MMQPQPKRHNAISAALIFGTIGWTLIFLVIYGIVGAIQTGGLW